MNEHEFFPTLKSALEYDEFISWDSRLNREIPFLLEYLLKGSVIDVACGSGRHSFALEEHGFKMVGIDASKNIIKEKIKKMQIAGIVLSVTGSFFVIFEQEIATFFSFSWQTVLGNLLAFASGFCWALYTIILKKFFSDRDPLTVTLITLFLGSMYIIPFAFIVFPFEMNLTLIGCIFILLISVISTSLAYTYWLSLLSYMGATETGIIQVLIPVFSTIFSILLLEESITYIFVIGATLIIAGMFLVEKFTVETLEDSGKNEEEEMNKKN
ncbi:MAG: EamA family transporter [Candidatus Heimdallarchaeaceae archaeon]